jgi:hypothetical protein
MKSWVSRPKVPGIHKVQIFKDLQSQHSQPWVMILPTRDMKSRRMIRYSDWGTPFETAMLIQDLRNEP